MFHCREPRQNQSIGELFNLGSLFTRYKDRLKRSMKVRRVIKDSWNERLKTTRQLNEYWSFSSILSSLVELWHGVSIFRFRNFSVRMYIVEEAKIQSSYRSTTVPVIKMFTVTVKHVLFKSLLSESTDTRSQGNYRWLFPNMSIGFQSGTILCLVDNNEGGRMAMYRESKQTWRVMV